MTYYTLPLRTDRLLRGDQLGQEDVREAINQNIKLILRSLTLSYRFDSTFGCVVHRYQAATPPQKRSQKAWREELRRSIENNLKDMLQRYEARILVKDVFVQLAEPSSGHARATVQVKVEVSGELTLGRKEKYNWPDSEVDEHAAEVLPLVIPLGRGK